MTSDPVRNVVVAGGGLEGWATAAALANSLRGTDITITVVDLAGLEPDAAAEHALPQTLDLFRHLGIDEARLVRDAGATFRLGTRRLDWPTEGSTSLIAFGRYGADVGFIPFHHYAVRAEARDLDGYSVTAMAATQHRFALPAAKPGPLLSQLAHGIFLDSTLTTGLLRGFAAGLGVRAVAGDLAEVPRDRDTGFIEALCLADGTRVRGELFLDCTGRAARLIGEALDTGYADWSDVLPCDRQVESVRVRAEPAPLVLDCRATDHGWMLRQPLQRHDVVSVLCPAGSAQDAVDEALQQAGGDVGTAREIRRRNGHRRLFWHGNCIALGTAAGALEPLVFSPLHLLHSGVSRLLRMLPDAACDPCIAEEYNRATRLEYENARDYVLISYAAARRDGAFWARVREAVLPESFRLRYELFTSTGRVPAFDEESFDRNDWSIAWLAAGVRPAAHDPLIDRMPAAELDGHFARLQAAIARAVGTLPGHDEFVERLRRPPGMPGSG